VNAAEELLRAGDDGDAAIRVHGEARRLTMTRGELRRGVRQAAAAFANLGVYEEQRVLVALPDGPEAVCAVLGAMWNGSVPVVLSTFLASDGYAAFLEESRARAVVTTEAVARALGGATPVLTVHADGSGTFRDTVAREPASAEPFPAHADDPALWLYSSGTTGRPKGVVHLHRGVCGVVATYGAQVLGTRRDDVAYATSKLFFAYGLGASVLFPLAAGATTVLDPDPFVPARTWRILAEERPSVFFSVPSA